MEDGPSAEGCRRPPAPRVSWRRRSGASLPRMAAWAGCASPADAGVRRDHRRAQPHPQPRRGSRVHARVRARGIPLHLSLDGAPALASHAHRGRMGGQRVHAQGLAGHRTRGVAARPPRVRQGRRPRDLPADPGGTPDRHRRSHGPPRARRTEAPRPVQRHDRRCGARRSRAVHRVRVGEPRVPRCRGRRRGAGARGHRARPLRAEALPDVPALGRQRPRARVPDLRESPGAGHPGDDPPSGLHADRREAGAGAPRHARRHRPGVPGPPRDHRPLRASVGRRSPVPAHQASALLHGALLPDRHAHTPRPVPAPLALRAHVRPAGEALLRHRLPGLPLRPGGAATRS